MGFSRDTFYRYQSAVESGGIEALIDANRRKPSIQELSGFFHLLTDSLRTARAGF